MLTLTARLLEEEISAIERDHAKTLSRHRNIIQQLEEKNQELEDKNKSLEDQVKALQDMQGNERQLSNTSSAASPTNMHISMPRQPQYTGPSRGNTELITPPYEHRYTETETDYTNMGRAGPPSTNWVGRPPPDSPRMVGSPSEGSVTEGSSVDMGDSRGCGFCTDDQNCVCRPASVDTTEPRYAAGDLHGPDRRPALPVYLATRGRADARLCFGCCWLRGRGTGSCSGVTGPCRQL